MKEQFCYCVILSQLTDLLCWNICRNRCKRCRNLAIREMSQIQFLGSSIGASVGRTWSGGFSEDFSILPQSLNACLKEVVFLARAVTANGGQIQILWRPGSWLHRYAYPYGKQSQWIWRIPGQTCHGRASPTDNRGPNHIRELERPTNFQGSTAAICGC